MVTFTKTINAIRIQEQLWQFFTSSFSLDVQRRSSRSANIENMQVIQLTAILIVELQCRNGFSMSMISRLVDAAAKILISGCLVKILCSHWLTMDYHKLLCSCLQLDFTDFFG